MRAKLEKSYKIFVDFQEEHVGKVVHVGRVQIPGMDGIVLQTLKECSGTCNILKALKTGKAPSSKSDSDIASAF